ncbi:MAG: integrase [Pseudomonadales bacterium RIFCSPLOWO2_12_59_9]|nr:MAG: integrase [Pseudomonadales bacterium RIFCSPLOWO2_12_59_9]
MDTGSPQNSLLRTGVVDLIPTGLAGSFCLVSEWLANIDNHQTRRAYRSDVRDFFELADIRTSEGLLGLSRGHVLIWRARLEKLCLSPATRRRKLAALASLFDYLIERDTRHTHNPVRGIKRPRNDSYEGKTPALNSSQAKQLLDAPKESSAKGQRDRALLAILLYHGLRRQEAADLRISDLRMRDGLQHLRVQGKGGKLRYIPLHEEASQRLTRYLSARGQEDKKSYLFVSLRGSKAGECLSADGIYKVVCSYARSARIYVDGLGVHGLRVTAATNALEHHADIAQVQHWLGHSSISTTRLYDRRLNRPSDSPSLKIHYEP